MASSARRDVLKLLSGSLLAKVLGTVSLMLFTRALPKTEMAVFPAFYMLAGIGSLVLTFGIFSTFTRELPSLIRTGTAQARGLVVTGSAVILAGTILPSLAAFVFSGSIAQFVFQDARQGWAIRMMVPGFLAFVICRIQEYVMWGRGQFGGTSTIQVLDSAARPIATVAFYALLGFPGVVLGLVVTQFVLAAAGFWYVRDILAAAGPWRYPLRKLIRESMFYYAGNYLSYLRSDGDSLLVTALLGPVALAEYYVAKTIYTNIGLILTAVDKVAVERLARHVQSPAFREKAIELHDRISQFLVPLSLLVIAVAPNLLIVLAGRRYADATWPAVLLLVAMMVQFISIPFARAVFVALPGGVRLKYYMVEAFIAVAAAVVLAHLAGLIGVSAARIFAPLGEWLIGAFLLRSHLKLHFPLRPTFLALATAGPGAALALVLVPRSASFAGAMTGIALALVVWSAAFISTATVLNRPLLQVLAAGARRQYRAVFPA